MSLLTDLFPRPGELRDRDADAALAALGVSLSAGTPEGLPGWAVPLAERMRQAEAKIAAGEPLKRTAELIALAQFGSGSLGRAVAEAFGAPADAAACESLLVAEFLASVAAGTGNNSGLVPPDATRASILDRAEQALAAATASAPHPATVRFRRRRAAFCVRRIRRLRRGHPTGAPGLWDRLAVALSLALGR